jgi:lipoprotein Spr
MKVQLPNFYFIGFFVLLSLSSCSTLKSISSKVQMPVAHPKPLFSSSNNEIEFLDNIAVTPGSVSIRKTIFSKDVEPVKSTVSSYDMMPANLSDVEKANWLQLKYSLKMDVAVEEVANMPLFQKIDEWWGTPYCLGGNSKGCVDCSFFTMDVMQSIYKTSLKRTAAEQYEQSTKINWDQLKQGDLIFFKTEGRRTISHVGIYLTNNKFVHASTSQGVTISDLADPYWQRRLYSLGRVSVP